MGMAAGRSKPMAASSSERGRRWSARLTARSKVGDIRAAPAERCGRGGGDPGSRIRFGMGVKAAATAENLQTDAAAR
uniref:Uncharacterized protein n=1 Tax=Oryza sativa subsp. japonica TaxID=39947 RepID=Q8W2Z1_ORYSJ|nr:hypothetical protein [Oryza sativa Japonica Group]